MPSKKANSFIFMAVATVLNILLLLLLFAAGIVILSFLPIEEHPQIMLFGVAIVFLVAIGLSFVIYSKVLQWAIRKFNLEQKMDPLFAPKRKVRKPTTED